MIHVSLCLFASLTQLQLCELDHYEAEKVVFSEGVAGTAFYVVISGILTVTVKGHPVAQLEPLTGFGELALVNDAPRKATIARAASGWQALA